MTSQLSRFQIIEGTPPSLPGKCAVCGTTQGPMVDFGLDLDFYGTVYLCVKSCMVEVALAFDYHGPKQWKMAQDEILAQRTQVNDLLDRNEALQNALDALGVVLDSNHRPIRPESGVSETSGQVNRDPHQLEFDFDTPEGKERTLQPIDERRPSDLRGLDSDDDDLLKFLDI